MTYVSFLRAECHLVWRRKQNMVNSVLFFLLVVVLFPLGIDATPMFLSKAASGIIWCAAALAILTSVESLFKEDYHDGSLEQWLVSGLSVPILVLIKMALHWLFIALPLLLLSPVLSEVLYLPDNSFWPLFMSLMLATPSLFLLGGIGSAVTVSLRQGGVLMLLIVLPLYLPIIIFATSVTKTAQVGLPYDAPLAILGAIFFVSLVVSPLMTAISIKASVN